jgi:hypothetical protein
MFQILDTKHPLADPTYGIGGNIISAIEVGLALITVCVPDLLPLIKTYIPKLLGRETTDKGSAGMYGYGTNSRNLRSTKNKGYVQTGSKNGTVVRGDLEAGYKMDNMDWDKSRTKDAKSSVANVYGGYPSPSSSLAGSDEGIIILDGQKQHIVKTTQISIQTTGNHGK